MYGPLDYQPVHGACPECGKLFEAIGAASLSITIGAHLYEDHGYPTRFWYPGKVGPTKYPAAAQHKLPLPADTAMEDYMAGRTLTAFDKGFLSFGGHGYGVCWNPPKGWPVDES